MQLADISLLAKKIVVGVVIAAIPLLILVGGLWLTRALLDHSYHHTISSPAHSTQ
jgi:hypothetical protein